jgi:putative nucleotidyltransferase with HDIG domain
MITGNIRYTGDLSKPYRVPSQTLTEGVFDSGDPAVNWLSGEGSSSLLYQITLKTVELLDVNYCQIIVLGAGGVFHPIAFHRTTSAAINRSSIPRDVSKAQNLLQRVLLNDQTLVVRYGDQRINLEERHALRAQPQDNLVIFPMRLDTEPIGVFILGFEKFIEVEKKIQLGQLFSRQAANALHREGLPYADEENVVEIVMALSQALETRDLSTGAHCRRITRLAELLAIKLGCSFTEVQTIRRAALLHDIGKIGIPDAILHKPGPLNDREWVIMRQHPEIGARILKMVRGLNEVSRLVIAHHERYNGMGYPYGLSGEKIPLGSRILSVVDAYGAMVMDRVYRPAMSYLEAVAELKRCAGKDFDPRVVEVFLQILDSTLDGLDDVG